MPDARSEQRTGASVGVNWPIVSSCELLVTKLVRLQRAEKRSGSGSGFDSGELRAPDAGLCFASILAEVYVSLALGL